MKFLALNVGTKKRNLIPDEYFKKGDSNLHNYLQKFNHEIFYEADKDVISGILNFKMVKDTQLLNALP